MTPYQRAAFLYPCLSGADFNRPGKGPPTPPAEAVGNAQAVAPVHHAERGFRVSMIVDCAPESAGLAEGWPAWHITVVLDGADRIKHRADRGKVHVERPLGAWGSLREKQALHIIRRELAGVGDPLTEVIVDKAGALENWRRFAGGRPEQKNVASYPVGVYGRRRLTEDEARACLAPLGRLDVLGRLNPTWAMLGGFGDEPEVNERR